VLRNYNETALGGKYFRLESRVLNLVSRGRGFGGAPVSEDSDFCVFDYRKFVFVRCSALAPPTDPPTASEPRVAPCGCAVVPERAPRCFIEWRDFMYGN